MKLTLVPLSLLVYIGSTAQPCIGSLGDPIVKYTFGSGAATYGGVLPPGITNMKYVESLCPDGGPLGAYAIVHSPGVNCFSSNWVNFSGDHTGDTNGYFMLINASDAPSDFYLQQVDGLCPGTSYEFGAWVINMGNSPYEIKPNITFTIEKLDGTVLQSYQTGEVPYSETAHWNQFTFYFTTPAGVSSVVLRMRNTAPGGYGNDLGLDDISFRASGPSLDIGMAGYQGGIARVCPDPAGNILLNSTIGNCYANVSYQWQLSTDSGVSWGNVPGASGDRYSMSIANTGVYHVRLLAAQHGNIDQPGCRVASLPDSIVVYAGSHPQIDITEGQNPICNDSIASLTARVVDAGAHPHFQWMVNDRSAGSDGISFSGFFRDGDRVCCRMTSDIACADNPDPLSNIVTLSVLQHLPVTVTLVSSAGPVCRDSMVIFTAESVNGGDHPVYRWLVGTNPALLSSGPAYATRGLDDGDIVRVILNSSLPCTTQALSNAIDMTVYEPPKIYLPEDTAIIQGNSLRLMPIVSDPVLGYSWSPGTGLSNPELFQPVASPAITTVYQLSVTNEYGCTAFASEKIQVMDDLRMPNAFTPNGDGHNDAYRVPPVLGLVIQHFSIFDRWGRMVFSTSDGNQGWDGTVDGHPAPADTYIWSIDYLEPISRQPALKKGTLVLVR